MPCWRHPARHKIHHHCLITYSTHTNCFTEIKSTTSQLPQTQLWQIRDDHRWSQILHPTTDTLLSLPDNTSTNLGVVFDSNLSFRHQINQITRTDYFHLTNIARLSPSLSFSAAGTLIHAFRSIRLLTHTGSRDRSPPVLQLQFKVFLLAHSPP